MIIKNDPLSMPEAKEYIEKSEVENKEIIGFIKNFTAIKNKDSIEMRSKIKELDLIQIGDSHIVKIIDLMPTNKEELNKILSNVNVGEDDSKKIIDIVSEFK